jgi:hypothetical protein
MATAVALALAGCTVIRPGPQETIKIGPRSLMLSGLEGFDVGAVTIPDPNAPNVFITGNQRIVVDQEPLRPTRVDADGFVTITWALPRGANYIFPDDSAIALAASTGNPLPTGLTCGAVKEKSFVCYYKKPEHSQRWKYTIKVKNKTTGTGLETLDPSIYQD